MSTQSLPSRAAAGTADGGPAAARSRPERSLPVTALAVWSTSYAMVLAAVVLVAVAGGLPTDTAYFCDPVYFALAVAVTLAAAPTAALGLTRSAHPVVRAAAVAALGYGSSALALGLAVGIGDGLPVAPEAVGHAFSWLWLPGGFLVLTAVPWYLRPDRPPAAARLAAAVGGVLGVVLAVAVARREPLDEHPLSPEALAGGDAVDLVALVGLALLGAAAALALVARWRTAPAEDRPAMRAITLTMLALVLSISVMSFWPPGPSREVARLVAIPVLLMSHVLTPLALTVLVLRHRLWGVNAALQRATLWFLLVGTGVSLYVGLSRFAGMVLPGGREVAGVAAVVVLAVVAQPVRRAFSSQVDLVFHGAASDPATLLAGHGHTTRAAGSHDGLATLVRNLCRGLDLAAVEVVTAEDPRVDVRAGTAPAHPDPAGRASLPLVVGRRHVGDLVLHAHPGRALELRALRVVDEVADVVAVSLDLAQANVRLRQATQRLGEVRHEERRLLRRELHDGLGPALAGLHLGLTAARRRLRHDPAAADALLAELEVEAERRTHDVRLVARALLPAQLDDGDLLAALDVLATRFRSGGLRVTVTGDAVADLPARLQVALYHVAAEAMTNAVRHAAATSVRVTVTRRDAGVVLRVADDGRGVPADHAPGVGLRSMRERAAEVGGELRMETGPAGTTVSLTLGGP